MSFWNSEIFSIEKIPSIDSNLCKYISKVGVKYLSLYAFSTENFKREVGEVNYLMNLFIEIEDYYLRQEFYYMAIQEQESHQLQMQ